MLKLNFLHKGVWGQNPQEKEPPDGFAQGLWYAGGEGAREYAGPLAALVMSSDTKRCHSAHASLMRPAMAMHPTANTNMPKPLSAIARNMI